MAKRKVSVRIEEDICKALEREAEANDTTLSKEIVRRLESAEVLSVDADKVDELRSALVLLTAELTEKNRLAKKYGSNVNQIAKQVNRLKGLSEKNDGFISRKMAEYAEWQKVEAEALDGMRKRVNELWQSLKP